MLRLGKPDGAISDFEKAIEVDSESPLIYNGLGNAYKALGNYEEALANMTISVERENRCVEFLVDRAALYCEMKSFSLAVRDLTNALELNLSDPQLFYKRGLAFYQSQMFKEAIKDFKESLANRPFPTYKPDIYYHLGLAYANLEMFNKAILPFTKCIELCPNEPVYFHERAKSYQMVEENEKALADFTMVIRLQPKNAHAYFRRGFSQKALKKYMEAAEDFSQARALQPDNPALVINSKKIHGVKCIVLCSPGQEPKFN